MQSVLNALPEIYDAALTQSNWTRALDAAVRASSAKGAMLFANDIGDLPYSSKFSSSLLSGMEEEIAAHMERFGEIELYGINTVLRSRPLEPVLDTDIWPDLPALSNRDDIISTKQLLGVYRRVSFNISSKELCHAGVIFQFSDRIKEIPSIMVDCAAAVAPHLSKAIEINRLVHSIYTKYRAVLSALDKLKLGAILLNENAEIILWNTSAEEIVDLSQNLFVNANRRLSASQSETALKLHKAVQRCARTSDGADNKAGETLIVSEGSATDPIVLEISPIRDGDDELGDKVYGALAFVIDPGQTADIDVSTCGRVFGWTRSELAIAQALMKGLDVNQIAEERRVQASTVRSQIKSIYSKSGVNSRIDLVRKAIALAPPII